MTTLFPGAVDSFSLKVDDVTKVMAADVNNLQDSVVAIETAVIAQSPNPNLLYHTLSHDIWPEGVTFNDVGDDSYVAGLWNAIHNGQNPDVSGEAAIIAGSKRAIKCLFDSASSQAGFVQFLSNEDTVPLRGKTLSFSIDTSTLNVSNMRCAILEWVGTADTITSDVVATWGAGNPTLATSWSYIGTPADQAISGTTRIKAEGKVVGATTTNLAMFVWNPALEASTDYFRLANAKLEIGLTATAFVAKSHQEELAATQQFIYAVGGVIAYQRLGTGQAISTGDVDAVVPFLVQMRIAPTITYSDITHFALSNSTFGVSTVTSINTNNGHGSTLGNLIVSGATGLVAGNSSQFLANNTTSARLYFNARL